MGDDQELEVLLVLTSLPEKGKPSQAISPNTPFLFQTTHSYSKHPIPIPNTPFLFQTILPQVNT